MDRSASSGRVRRRCRLSGWKMLRSDDFIQLICTQLIARCQAVLDRLAGKSGAGEKSAVPFGARPIEPNPERIEAATKKALGYLTSAFHTGWKAPDGFSPDDLVLYAWTSANVAPQSADVIALRDRVLSTKLSGTYQAALRALALSKLDAKTHCETIEACATFLVSSQTGKRTMDLPSAKGRRGAQRRRQLEHRLCDSGTGSLSESRDLHS